MFVDPGVPRTCSWQRQRQNVPASSPSEYYRRALTIPILDELIGQMKTRFSNHHTLAMKAMYLVPALDCRNPIEGNAKVLDFAREYVDDLPPGQSLQTLAAELEHWHLLLQELSSDELPSTTQEALRFAVDKLCPCITRLLELPRFALFRYRQRLVKVASPVSAA